MPDVNAKWNQPPASLIRLHCCQAGLQGGCASDESLADELEAKYGSFVRGFCDSELLHHFASSPNVGQHGRMVLRGRGVQVLSWLHGRLRNLQEPTLAGSQQNPSRRPRFGSEKNYNGSAGSTCKNNPNNLLKTSKHIFVYRKIGVCTSWFLKITLYIIKTVSLRVFCIWAYLSCHFVGHIWAHLSIFGGWSYPFCTWSNSELVDVKDVGECLLQNTNIPSIFADAFCKFVRGLQICSWK